MSIGKMEFPKRHRAILSNSCMASTLDADNPFVQWLIDELDTRRWSRADLARAMAAHPSLVTKVLNRELPLSVDVAKRIAAALGVKQIDLFRIAGLIDDLEGEGDDAQEKADFEEMRRILSRMEPERRAEALKWLEAYGKVVERDKRAASAATSPRPARGSAAPATRGG